MNRQNHIPKFIQPDKKFLPKFANGSFNCFSGKPVFIKFLYRLCASGLFCRITGILFTTNYSCRGLYILLPVLL